MPFIFLLVYKLPWNIQTRQDRELGEGAESPAYTKPLGLYPVSGWGRLIPALKLLSGCGFPWANPGVSLSLLSMVRMHRSASLAEQAFLGVLPCDLQGLRGRMGFDSHTERIPCRQSWDYVQTHHQYPHKRKHKHHWLPSNNHFITHFIFMKGHGERAVIISLMQSRWAWQR